MPMDFAEGRVTRMRREVKLLVEDAQLGPLLERLGMHKPGFDPQPTRITSVYFDRPGQPLAQRAQNTPHNCLKVRTKEYFPDLFSNGEDRVVLEAKRERNGLTHKRRAWLPRERLTNEIREENHGVARMITAGTMQPVLAVSYMRCVYQAEEQWRLTVDREIEFFAITPSLALSAAPLSRERLGTPFAREPRAVVELKFMGESMPSWLEELTRKGSARFSKFAEGMRRLHEAAIGIQGG